MVVYLRVQHILERRTDFRFLGDVQLGGRGPTYCCSVVPFRWYRKKKGAMTAQCSLNSNCSSMQSRVLHCIFVTSDPDTQLCTGLQGRVNISFRARAAGATHSPYAHWPAVGFIAPPALVLEDCSALLSQWHPSPPDALCR